MSQNYTRELLELENPQKGYLVSGFHVNPNEISAESSKIDFEEKIIIE